MKAKEFKNFYENQGNLSTTELCDSYINIVKKLTQKTREKISKKGGAQFELFILKEKIEQFEKLLSRELDARNFVEVDDEVNYKKWCKLDDSRASLERIYEYPNPMTALETVERILEN